jgi:hypothetical protein
LSIDPIYLKYFVIKLKNHFDAQEIGKELLALSNEKYPYVTGNTLAKILVDAELKR